MTSCIWLTKDGCKGLGGSSVGYWGRDVYKTMASDSVNKKNSALLEDQIAAAGIRAYLWKYTAVGDQCSCYKDSYTSPDRKCSSCHGMSKVPGFLKWGHKTVWMSPNDSDAVLSNVEITTDFRSSKCVLSGSALTGTIESPDKPFSRTAIGSVWESNEVSFIRIKNHSSVVTEYSLDSGRTWKALSQLPIENPASGTIRFRTTITRVSTEVLSPFFEIVRARFGELDLSDPRGDEYQRGPFIKVMSPVPDQDYIKHDYGDSPVKDSMTVWTVGMGAFDPRIVRGTREELLEGPNVLLELLDGAQQGIRFWVTSWSNSDPSGYLISTQTLNIRQVDSANPFALIW